MPTTIMIVDDTEIIRKLVRVALGGFEHTDFLEAEHASEALKISREHQGPIHLLISDVVMPGRINGIEMAARLCHTRPETKVLLMSGYAPDVLTTKPEWSFVQKPFAPSEIHEKVRSILTENCLVAAY
jgi:two-component system cell cycle sensor histidine kinase/response regulator CckA